MTAYPTQTTFKTLLLRDDDSIIAFSLLIDFESIIIQNYTEGVHCSMTIIILADDVWHRCTDIKSASGYAKTGLLKRCGD